MSTIPPNINLIAEMVLVKMHLMRSFNPDSQPFRLSKQDVKLIVVMIFICPSLTDVSWSMILKYTKNYVA